MANSYSVGNYYVRDADSECFESSEKDAESEKEKDIIFVKKNCFYFLRQSLCLGLVALV